MLVFRFNYFLLAVLILVAEVLIGAYMHDAFIRPYGGDFLVVILLYCLLMSFCRLPVGPAALGVLLVEYTLHSKNTLS